MRHDARLVRRPVSGWPCPHAAAMLHESLNLLVARSLEALTMLRLRSSLTFKSRGHSLGDAPWWVQLKRVRSEDLR